VYGGFEGAEAHHAKPAKAFAGPSGGPVGEHTLD
jgi:hypothetical protein